MKTGARNNITGTVTELKKGTLMSQVKVRVAGPVDVSSVMTLDSLQEMQLKKGDRVTVLIKAVSVLLVKE